MQFGKLLKYKRVTILKDGMLTSLNIAVDDEITSTKITHFWRNCYYTSFQDCNVSGDIVTPTS
jgi:hypothetical protein